MLGNAVAHHVDADKLLALANWIGNQTGATVGFLTEAARAGASLPKMQEVSRQKKVEVLLGYVRDAALFENHAGEGFL